jgi:ribosome-associated protein
MKQSNHSDEFLIPEKPSKSEIKRRLEARQYLAEEISKMTPDKWKQMPLPERLLDALKETPQVRSHGGIRRHIQYLGKIMGALSEEEVQEIKQALIGMVGAKKASKMKI